MVEVQETSTDATVQGANIWYWMTLGAAAFGALIWLTVGVQRLLTWRGVLSRVNAAMLSGDLERAQAGQAYAGSMLVDFGFALATVVVLAYVVIAVSRRTWNAWDHATLVLGFASTFTLIMLCARTRIMFFIPFTTFPVLALLYAPGTKRACGVGHTSNLETPEEKPVVALDRHELEREISKEQALIMQLSQNLDVFEVERALDTDRFVARYTEGLEEDSTDNAEWFAIARAVRRSRERLVALQSQLEALQRS